MNRNIKSTSVIICAVLALAGCSKTDELRYDSDSALQIESVSGISPFTLMQNPVSKAVIAGESLPGDEAAKGIGLFVTASDGGTYDGHDNGYTNVKYTLDGNKWSAQSPIYLSDNDGKLYGYFPYNADATELRAIPVQSSLNGTDYLYAKSQTVSHTNKNVSLEMNHALSRLHLTIKKGANFTANAPLSKITLKSTAIDATGTMDITTGGITASKKSGETGTIELATDGEITAEGIVKDILLVPADDSEGKKDISISLLIAGKPAGITLSGENGLDIRSGIQNNVTLTIEDTGIKVEGVGVGVWGEGDSQQVQVGAHKVTVRLAEDVTPHDILTGVYVDGNTVKIEACSKSGKIPVCSITGDGTCTKTNTNNIYAFTISSIVSDVTVTIGCMHDGVLTGVFTISKDGGITKNKIYFSKGNLWADSSKALHFETNQWEFAATSPYSTDHVSHFTWSSTITAAVGTNNSGDFLFCDENHKVSVDDSPQMYYALSKEEWSYLINTRKMMNVDFRYTLNITYGGKKGLVLYPDDYVGVALSGTVTVLPEGVVFIPSAGYRNGSNIFDVYNGHYASSSTSSGSYVCRLFFDSRSVEFNKMFNRWGGPAVRLVTNYNFH